MECFEGAIAGLANVAPTAVKGQAVG
jgi:hypothetical protein